MIPAALLLSFAFAAWAGDRNWRFAPDVVTLWGFGWLLVIVWFGMLHK
jgi:hypothetical protein